MRILLVGPRAAAHAFDARHAGVPADTVLDVASALAVLPLRRYGTVIVDPTLPEAEALAALLGPSMDGRLDPLLTLAGPGLLLEIRSACKGTRVLFVPRSEERMLERLWAPEHAGGRPAAVGA